MKTEKTFYTYFHTRNDTNAVFYVGKGHGNRAHDSKDRNAHWRHIVAKHGRTVHIAAQWSSESEALQHEKFLILCFKDLRVPLCNMTDGGEGVCGLKHSDETKEKLRVLALRQMQSVENREYLRIINTGRSASAETRAKLSAVSLGLIRTDATKEKQRQWNLGRVMSDEAKLNMRKAKLGRVLSEETKARMSASQTERWKRKRGE